MYIVFILRLTSTKAITAACMECQNIFTNQRKHEISSSYSSTSQQDMAASYICYIHTVHMYNILYSKVWTTNPTIRTDWFVKRGLFLPLLWALLFRNNNRKITKNNPNITQKLLGLFLELLFCVLQRSLPIACTPRHFNLKFRYIIFCY